VGPPKARGPQQLLLLLIRLCLAYTFSGEVCSGSWCIHSCLPFGVWGWSFQFANLSVAFQYTSPSDSQE